MPLTPNFTVSQNPLLPNEVVVTDTSSGSDVSITGRRVFVQDAYGNYLVPTGTTTSYVVWPLSDLYITLDILSKDMAVSITVQWVDINGGVVATLTNQYALPEYGKQFLYYLVQLQGDTPTIPADSNYNANLAILWTNIRGAINAVEINADIVASQNCLNRATYMQLNEAKFF